MTVRNQRTCQRHAARHSSHCNLEFCLNRPMYDYTVADIMQCWHYDFCSQLGTSCKISCNKTLFFPLVIAFNKTHTKQYGWSSLVMRFCKANYGCVAERRCQCHLHTQRHHAQDLRSTEDHLWRSCARLDNVAMTESSSVWAEKSV